MSEKDHGRGHRRPGDRVVRRRLDARQVIEIPPAPELAGASDAGFHAKQFLAGYVILVIVGTILLTLPWSSERHEFTPILDALFTSVSASSVTGLVVVETQDHWSFFGEVVILGLIQAGGLGFMVGASLLLAVLRQSQSLRGAMLLQDGTPTLSLEEAVRLSRRILRFLLMAEAIGAVSLTAFFMRYEPPLLALWHGVFTSISAFCNAGFDLQGSFQSMASHGDSWWLNVTVMMLIQFGALSYIVFEDIWSKRSWRTLALDVKLVLIMNAVLLIVGTIVFLAIEWRGVMAGEHLSHRLLMSMFQSVSLRTAGFATVNFSELHMATLFACIGIMAVGGASGSTAGGVKLATAGVLALAVRSVVMGQQDIHAFGRRISETTVYRAMSIVAMFMVVHFTLTLALSVTEEQAGHRFGFVALMFETMSGMATVGLSTGITHLVSDPGKVVLCVAMFVGRLGPLTVAYALQGHQSKRLFRYPEAPVRIG